MFNSILIIDKSKIIQEGLRSILNTGNVAKQIVCLDDIENYQQVFKNREPDVIIISPAYIQTHLIDKFRNRYQVNQDIILIGFVYQYYDQDVLSTFSELIYITDPVNIIISKIKNLFQKGVNSENNGDCLSEREKEVLRLLLSGLSNKEVAEKLIISPHTVMTHRKNIIEKTGIRSLAGLAVYAIINNITNMNEIHK